MYDVSQKRETCEDMWERMERSNQNVETYSMRENTDIKSMYKVGLVTDSTSRVYLGSFNYLHFVNRVVDRVCFPKYL